MKIPKEFYFVWSKIENKKKVYWGMAATFFISGISAVIPYLYGRLVDVSIKQTSPISLILSIILLWVILSLIRDAVGRISSRFSYEIAADIWTKLHIEAITHLINLPMQFHKENKMGKVLDKIGRGIENLYSFIESTIFSFAPSVVSFFIALFILAFVEWRLTIILVIASIIYIAVTLSYAREINKANKTLNKLWENAFGDRHDTLFNVEAVKTSTNEDFEARRSQINYGKANTYEQQYRFILLKMEKWQSLIFTLSFIAVFSFGVFMLRAGNLTPGKLIMFVGYISLLTSPLARVADQYRRVKRVLSTLKRTISIFATITEKDNLSAKDAQIKGDIIFDNISFNYRKKREILKNISFEIRAGESVALVGESGVGKTTIVNLLGRYYAPQKGKILIDGTDIRKIKLKSLRGQTAIVPQEVLLFNDTIKNNIRYGRQNATDKEIIEAAKAANAHEFIETFPKKYEQLVGERGIKLSTGQKQRIAIARAILRNPKILILDEATSALDSHSERLVQEALRHLIKGRTTFVIAHRLSTIQHANKIIVLEKGTIAEMGTHNDLMQNPHGIYRNFWELQSAIQKVK